jgi:hypothetical protein
VVSPFRHLAQHAAELARRQGSDPPVSRKIVGGALVECAEENVSGRVKPIRAIFLM